MVIWGQVYVVARVDMSVIVFDECGFCSHSQFCPVLVCARCHVNQCLYPFSGITASWFPPFRLHHFLNFLKSLCCVCCVCVCFKIDCFSLLMARIVLIRQSQHNAINTYRKQNTSWPRLSVRHVWLHKYNIIHACKEILVTLWMEAYPNVLMRGISMASHPRMSSFF